MVPTMTNVVIKKYHAIIFLKPIPILRITEIAKVIIRRTKRYYATTFPKTSG